jgi:hypothetical protein
MSNPNDMIKIFSKWLFAYTLSKQTMKFKIDMLLKILLFLVYFLSFSQLFPNSSPLTLNFTKPYRRGPFITEKAWTEVQPYLLPLDHPAKPILDRIFSKKRATSSHLMMKKAGFSVKQPRGNRRVTVAKHPKIKGYLIKTYLDSQNVDQKEWEIWIHRIKGANKIQTSIESHGYCAFMKTPKKWIYPLPPISLEKEGPFRQNFILFVENMHILSNEANKLKYYQALTKEKLEALYVILKENLLIDSIYLDNIPFCKDGKIAFIDTEHYLTKERPLKLHRLTKYFSPLMQNHWNQILQNGGPIGIGK